MQNNTQEQRTRLYIILGFIVMSLIVAGIVAIFYQLGTPASKEPNQNERVDKSSGQTVLDPEGKSPETYGTNPDAPIYLGFDELLNTGVNFDQVTKLKTALGDFAYQKTSQKTSEFSLTKSTITHTQNPDGPDIYTFTLVVNQKDSYKATLTIPDISSIQLALATEDGVTQVFTAQK